MSMLKIQLVTSMHRLRRNFSGIIRYLTAACFALVVTIGCASKQPDIILIDDNVYTGTEDLHSLQNLAASSAASSKKEAKVSPIRRTAIEETALSVGAQAGLAWRGKHINAELHKNNRYLDNIFDFNSLILENNVLPPVLLEGRQTLNLDDPNTLRFADRTYKIDKQARFVTTPPNWREYLWLTYEKPPAPHRTLLPKNSTEREIWDVSVTQGWQRGIYQANIIFSDNLARLREDYLGMILYRKLLAQNIVTAPHVARTELGITGDNSEMNVDDQILRITAHPQLQLDSAIWSPAVSNTEEEYRLQQQIEKLLLESELTWSDDIWHPVIDDIERPELL